MRMGMMTGIPRKHAHTNLLSISYSGNPFLSLSPRALTGIRFTSFHFSNLL